MTFEALYKEMGRMLAEHPEAANDPVVDSRYVDCGEAYQPDFEVAKIVLHDPGDEDAYVTLECI